MNVRSAHKRMLSEVVGDTAVMALIEKHGDDAIEAVYAMLIESSNWSVTESFEYVMQYYEGTFEETSDYLAALHFEHMQNALDSYAKEHQITWPLDTEEMLNHFNWDDIAEQKNGVTYFAYQTMFGNEAKQYFIFKKGAE